MSDAIIVSPSSERAADELPFAGRFLPALFAVCGALISLLFVAHVGAAAPLSGVTQIVQHTTAPVTNTINTTVKSVVPAAQPSKPAPQAPPAAQPVQSVAHTVAPVAQAVAPVTQAIAPVVHAAAPVVQTANTVVQPIVQTAAAPPAQAVIASTAPVTQPVVQAAAPVVKTAQTIAAPVVQTMQAATTPVVRQVTTITAPVVQAAAPVAQTVTKPVVRQVTTATAPVVQSVAPVVQPAVTTIAVPATSSEPIPAPVVQAVATTIAPIIASITPALQTLQAAPVTATAPATAAITAVAPALRASVADARRFVAPESPAPINRAERLPASDTTPKQVAAPMIKATIASPSIGVSPRAVAIPPTGISTVHHAVTAATDTFSAFRAVTVSLALPPQGIVLDTAFAFNTPSVAQADFNDQTDTRAHIAPTAPPAPLPPMRLPVDVLATTTSATGTSGGHGLSLLLSLATDGWARALTGQRIPPSALNLKQLSYRPLVSPG